MSLRFSLSTEAMKADIARLWQLCFGDSDAYIDFYLDNGFVPERVLVGFEGDVLAAMLTMVPAEASTNGRSLRGRYIFAVATHPDYQRRGFSTELLDEAHRRMRAEKVDFCVLVPASEDLFRFYGKRGFETAFYLNHTETGAEDIPLESSIDLRSIPLEDCFELRNSNFSGSALYCGWPKETLRFIDSECRYHGGETLQFAYNGRNGYAVCYPHGDALSVKECVPADTAQHILPALHKRYGKQHYHFRLPAGAEDGSGFGMVYWYSEAADLLKGSAPYLSLVLD